MQKMTKISFLFLLSALLIVSMPLFAQDEVSSSPAEPVPLEQVIDDFEAGIPLVTDEDGTGIGYVPWGDQPENVVLSARQLIADSRNALPGLADAPNTVLAAEYHIASWGGFLHAFTDGERWTGMDWTDYNAFSFWIFGNSTGGQIRVEVMDNLNPDFPGDSAERFFYNITDAEAGWRQITIPFSQFTRRADYQPPGALDDGFGLDSVSGYAFSLPAGTGLQVALFDQVGLTTVESDEVIVWAAEGSSTLEAVESSVSAAPARIVYDLEAENLWNAREWELVWSDEFEGEAGTPPNPDHWTPEIGGSGWGNNEHQFYTDSLENASLDGQGNLAIVAREESVPTRVCTYGVCRYSSARLITRDNVAFTFGRFEARMQIPRGQGIWPAFWMLGTNIRSVGWPQSGEIDVMENVGFEPRTLHGTIHGPGYSAGEAIGAGYSISEPLADDFHVYAVEWDADAIRWYLDGELYHMVTPTDLNGDEWVFNRDFYLLLNIAVGGNWPGYPDETTVFPQTLLVDYVRVYQLAGE